MANQEKAELKIETASELATALRAKLNAAAVQEQRAAGGEAVCRKLDQSLRGLLDRLDADCDEGWSKLTDPAELKRFVARYVDRARGIVANAGATEGARKVMASGMVAAFREAVKTPEAMIAAEARKAGAAESKAAEGKRTFSADVDADKRASSTTTEPVVDKADDEPVEPAPETKPAKPAKKKRTRAPSKRKAAT